MTLPEYKNHISDKTAAVLGVGVSNVPLIKFLLKHGAKVIGFDKRSKDEIEGYDELVKLGAKFCLGEDYLGQLMELINLAPRGDEIECCDLEERGKNRLCLCVFKTPGIRPDIPELLAAKERGIEITSEMELFLKLCPAPIIGITGSDGKTTTTSILYELLKTSGKSAFLGGNIGTPLIAQVENITKEDIVALEVSSFQLYNMAQSPDIGVITNITPNHLDWHTNMEEYIEAKKSICGLNSQKTHTVVLNADNDITRKISEEISGLKKVILFSKNLISDGVCIENGYIVRREYNQTTEKFLKVDDIKLPGTHNVENYMAAIAASLNVVTSNAALHVANSFGGVAHRIEFVRELNGVRFYNDSIATTPARAKAGLHSFSQKLTVIAGGYDKKIPFDEFGETVNDKVKTLVLFGETADKIEKAVKSASNYNGEVNIIRAKGGNPYEILRNAIVKASEFTASESARMGVAGSADPNDGLHKNLLKDIVILSPACASFDMFSNFEERGNYFKEIVMKLK